MSIRGTATKKDRTEENANGTNVLDEQNVSRETSMTNLSFKELYRGFRSNKLSRIESAYNAAYLYCNDKYYTSGAQLKERYRNIYAHPDNWFRHESMMWRHNRWSAAVKLLELIPTAKRSAEITATAAVPVVKDKAVSFWRHMEYSHIGIKAVGRFLLRAFIIALSIASLAGVVYTVHANMEKTPLLEVYIDGKRVGLTESVETIEHAQKVFEETESLLLGSSYVLDCTVTYKPVTADINRVMKPSEINAVFRDASLVKMSEGYGLYVDDMLVCVSPYKAWLDTAVNDSLQSKKHDLIISGIDLDNVTYYNNMTVVSGLYPNSLFMTENEIREMFSLSPVAGQSKEQDAVSVTNVLPERSTVDKAAATDITQEGTQAVTQKHSSTTLSVVIERTITTMEIIPYETVHSEEPNLVEGRTKIGTRGINGTKKVTYTVGYLDGDEVTRRIIDEEIITPATSEVILVGTRPMTEEEKRTRSTGTYIMPAKGRQTSKYGWRVIGGSNEFHKGYDIASSIGTDILASDGGEIIHARYDNSGYGLSIQILHDNGTITRYAHCSKVYVEEGQRVAQGEIIAAMGNTGYVTGVHLHFEVLVNGRTCNPGDYIKEE